MKNFKKLFERYRIDGYLVPKNDEYFNEYVPSSKDRLKFISNFSGSAGLAVILKNKNYLFVDGRYTIQAQRQSGRKFKVITIPNKLPKNILKTNKIIILGFDPKLHTEKNLIFLFKIKNIRLKPIKQNLIDMNWSNKPKELIKPFYSLPTKNVGRAVEKKIALVKKILLKNNTNYLLVTAPENIAWILNIRGQDTLYSPIPNAKLLINQKGEADLFANPEKLIKLKNIKVRTHDEKKFEKILNGISRKKIWLDSLSCSFFYWKRKIKLCKKQIQSTF